MELKDKIKHSISKLHISEDFEAIQILNKTLRKYHLLKISEDLGYMIDSLNQEPKHQQRDARIIHSLNETRSIIQVLLEELKGV